MALASIVGLWVVSHANSKHKAAPIKPPDIGKAPTEETILQGDDITLQLVDKNDPGRLAAELRLPSIQPLEAKRYAVQTPSGWLFPRDGRVVWIRADKADLFLPNRQQLPERGDFRGNVIVRLFEGPAGRKIDPEAETPLMEARSEHMAFDGAIGELQVPERLVVVGSGVQYAGKGVRALFNDPEQRLELLTAETSEYLRYNPVEARKQPSLWNSPSRPLRKAGGRETPNGAGVVRTAAAQTAPGATGSVPPAVRSKTAPAQFAPTSGPRITLYHVHAEREVVATQGQRTIESDELDVFARLINNQFPKRGADGALVSAPTDRAIGPGREPGWAASSKSVAVVPASLQAAPAEPAATAPDRIVPGPRELSRGSNDDPVEVLWKGRLEIRPLASEPELLASNDLSLRFTGKENHVRLDDRVSKVRGVGDVVSYLDTRREAQISSLQPGGVLLRAEKSGRVIATDARMDLARGVATFRGPGRLENIDSEDSEVIADRAIAWIGSGSLVFAPDEKGDPKSLLWADFSGGVEARGGAAKVIAETLAAEFDPAFADRPMLRHVLLAGGARATDAQGGGLSARTIDVRFAPPTVSDGEVVAQILQARGDVEATAKGSRLTSQELDSGLGIDAEGKLAATIVAARGGAVIEGRDGLRLECDELAADVVNESAELAGEIVVLAKGESRVTGQRMRLEGATTRLDVVGAGTFHHEGVSKAGDRRVASARWTQGMTYEDATGELEARGDALAEAMPDERTRDKLQAEYVKVMLTPAGEKRSSAAVLAEGKSGAGSGPDREVLSVQAIGQSDGAPAKVESRRYQGSIAEGDDAPKLERLLYLESKEVQADNRAGTLRTPGPGKILVFDKREGSKAQEPGEPRTDGRGRTLFSWQDSMSMERPTQTMRMNGTVKMTNERPQDRQITQLDCDRLMATLREDGRDPMQNLKATGEMHGELSRAIADGNARLKSGTKQLLGEIIDYNAVAGIATAGSQNGTLVSLIDDESASPITAKSIAWDLLRGRVEIKSVSTVVAPH